MPDWTDAPYVRVYLTLPGDQPVVWRDPALLGWWLRCLVTADRWYPSPAPLPARMPVDYVEQLVGVGVLEMVDEETFNFHGLDAQRRDNANRGRKGGVIRARTARRGDAGRFAGGTTLADAGLMNGRSSEDAGTNAGHDAGGTSLVTSDRTTAGDQRTSEEIRHDTTPTSQPKRLVGVSSDRREYRARDSEDDLDVADPINAAYDPAGPLTPGERAAMVRNHGPDDAPCDEVAMHALHHRWYAGVGWRCLLCENAETRSFDDRIIEAGGKPLF